MYGNLVSLIWLIYVNIGLMKSLIISDIHANLTALETVLKDAREFDAVWVLGDLVGYGPDPNECIELVKNFSNLICLLGNHDAATLGHIDDITFNPAARQAIRWTRKTITPENLEYISKLPESVHFGEITFAHGSPREPVWEYLLDTRNATENFKYFHTPYCFVGHTHLPTMYILNNGDYQASLIAPEKNTRVLLHPRAIINPGSVGQPRDRDPRAAYAIFNQDDMTIEFRRVAYDIQDVQGRMRQVDLPQRHIQRLADGW
jgi:diadenosine tetraphosphatase ApaH/serine/threonine PP2A family protein phosphatase